jgi:hypothetical protein
LDTVLEAARRLTHHPEIAFCFIGGGSKHAAVARFAKAHGLSNILCLPYQPIEAVSGSLSSADLHLITMGDAFAGIVHPCKIYNILALGMPFLYLGPQPSHITDAVEIAGIGEAACRLAHGDVESVMSHILLRATRGRDEAAAQRHRDLAVRFSEAALLPRMVSLIASLVDDFSQQSVSVSAPLR